MFPVTKELRLVCPTKVYTIIPPSFNIFLSLTYPGLKPPPPLSYSTPNLGDVVHLLSLFPTLTQRGISRRGGGRFLASCWMEGARGRGEIRRRGRGAQNG